jgi:hypothetical protein
MLGPPSPRRRVSELGLPGHVFFAGARRLDVRQLGGRRLDLRLRLANPSERRAAARAAAARRPGWAAARAARAARRRAASAGVGSTCGSDGNALLANAPTGGGSTLGSAGARCPRTHLYSGRAAARAARAARRPGRAAARAARAARRRAARRAEARRATPTATLLANARLRCPPRRRRRHFRPWAPLAARASARERARLDVSEHAREAHVRLLRPPKVEGGPISWTRSACSNALSAPKRHLR